MPEDKKIPVSFAVSIYGQLRPYSLNPALSQARVRTFYKYMNRNGSYLTDEIADNLIARAPGSPIIGHYDVEKEDFTSHMQIEKSKAYGFIPPDNSAFAWEMHLDKDGILRNYACFDVLLWTGRYEEAKRIPGKSQSMELDPKTIKGEWKFENNVEAFFYTTCELSGLCVLGEEVEPCFEGAAFYNLDTRFNLYVDAIREEIVKNFALQTNKLEGGKKKMPIKFNLPHENNFETLFNLMNPKFNEENEFLVEYMVHTVSENELYAYSYADKKNYLVKYTTNEEGTISLGEPQELSTIFGLTSEEQSALPEFVVVGDGMITNISNKITEYEAKIEELTAAVASKDEEITKIAESDFEVKITDLEAKIENFKSQLHAYEAEKATALEMEKNKLIDDYANLLDAEEISKYKANQANYTKDELEGKLAVQFARTYRNAQAKDVKLPGNNQQEETSPVLRALHKYQEKKKGE